MLCRYLDPKNDLSFRKIFGTEKHKRIPIDLLNAVFNLKCYTTCAKRKF